MLYKWNYFSISTFIEKQLTLTKVMYKRKNDKNQGSSLVLKDSLEGADLAVRGMAFQSLGTNTENTSTMSENLEWARAEASDQLTSGT